MQQQHSKQNPNPVSFVVEYGSYLNNVQVMKTVSCESHKTKMKQKSFDTSCQRQNTLFVPYLVAVFGECKHSGKHCKKAIQTACWCQPGRGRQSRQSVVSTVLAEEGSFL